MLKPMALAGLLLQAVIATAAPAQVADRWGPLLHWRATGNLEAAGGVPAGWYLSPIHAALLPNGQALFIARARAGEGRRGPQAVYAMAFRMDPDALPDPDGTVWVDEDAVPVECGGSVPALELPGSHHWGEASERRAGEAPSYPEAGGCGGEAIALTDHIGCSGHVLTADGRLFVAGGTRALIAVGDGEHRGTFGLPNAFLFDAGPAGWQRIAEHMVGRGPLGKPLRWYPTATRLADSRILVTSGFERVDDPIFNRSVELWDPQAGDSPWRLLSADVETPPEIVSPNYPHVFVLPAAVSRNAQTFGVLMLGAAGLPVLFSTAPAPAPGGRWWVGSLPRPGTDDRLRPSRSASSLLLPLRLTSGASRSSNGAVQTVGGYGPAAQRIDEYDPVRDGWAPSIDMGVGRAYPSAVLLPDLHILVVAGTNEDGEDGERERKAQYLDAISRRLEEGGAAMGESRGYHSVTLLLPDGRVLVGGGVPAMGELVEQPTFRYLSPPYMEQPRPQITVAPATLRYGERFDVTWDGGDALAEADLLALGSMTHAVDMGQRTIQLAIESVDQGAGTATLQAPPDASWAPSGHYMLVLLDERRVPSEAHILHLGP